MKTPVFQFYDPFNGVVSKRSDEFETMSAFWMFFERTVEGGNEPKLMQMIGRTDKIGVELFSGDILRIAIEKREGFMSDEQLTEGHRIGVIRYQPSKGFVISRAIECWDDDGEYKKSRGAFEFSSCNCLRVGNIHSDAEFYDSLLYGIKRRAEELKAGGES